ncbi:MAG: AAA-like domain-containing protein [Cyanobacteria bacterium P01_H01_bin.15]
MDSEQGLTWPIAQQLVDRLLFESTDKHLSDIESQVLQGAWEGKSYGKIAEELGYTLEYINSDVGYGLWGKLSKASGEKLTKRNFKGALERQWKALNTGSSASPVSSRTANIQDSVVAIHPQQPHYIDRPPIEQRCFEAIVQPGALIRIKAPRKMGKTALVERILHYAEQQNYWLVSVNLLRIESSVINDLERFLKYFCTRVTRQLKIGNKLGAYWDDELGSNTSCTEYFEEYILQQDDRPIVLALDNVDRLFPCAEVAANFFSLLRAWYEDARILPDWQRLRLIIAHSTDIYPTLNVNRSPFNVGLAVELTEFTAAQIAQLVQGQRTPAIKELQSSLDNIKPLTELIGGHPYLLQQALDYLGSEPDTTLETLITIAPTEAGPYAQHLRNLLAHLQSNEAMATAMKQVLQAAGPIRIKSELGFMLHSLGLVRFAGNDVEIHCPLYQQYFSELQSEF